MSEILTKSSFFQMGRGSSPMVARKTVVLKMGFSRKAAFETRKCRERPTLYGKHTHTWSWKALLPKNSSNSSCNNSYSNNSYMWQQHKKRLDKKMNKTLMTSILRWEKVSSLFAENLASFFSKCKRRYILRHRLYGTKNAARKS